MQFCAAIAVCSWPFERTKTLKDYVCKHNFEIHCILLPPISVRISDGKVNENTTVGTVEMFHHGNWVTICADDFDDRDAKVVCKELGFPNSKALVPGTFLRFEPATGFKMSTRTTLLCIFFPSFLGSWNICCFERFQFRSCASWWHRCRICQYHWWTTSLHRSFYFLYFGHLLVNLLFS